LGDNLNVVACVGLESIIEGFMRTQLLAATALSTTVTFLVPGVAVAQQYDWSGFYTGMTLGAAKSLGLLELDELGGGEPLPDSVIIPALGPTGGLHAGFNLQSGNFIYGLEGQASWVSLEGIYNDDGIDAEASLTALLSLRARLGVAFDRMMIYSTAGIAAGNSSFNVDAGKGSPASASGTVAGGIVGIGAEYAVNDNISLRAEGKYYHLQSQSAVGDSGKGTDPFAATYTPRGLVFETGVNVHF
jgi:outer membrane immunogenic protein